LQKRVKESLLWSGIYILLLLSLISPLNFLTVHFLMIPIVALFVKLQPKQFAIYYAIVLIVIFFLTGPFGWVVAVISLFFLAPSVMMGISYKKKASARTALMAGTTTMLAQLLLGLVLITLNGVNIHQAIGGFIRDSLDQAPDIWKAGLTDEVLDHAIQMMLTMIPSYLIFLSLYYVVITHWIGRRILIKTGEQIPGLRPIKEWMLPKSLVWYYLAALIVNLFVPADSDSIWSMILWNLIPLLMFTFAIQAISFLFYLADAKGWNKTLPIIGIVLFPLLPNLLSLLGVFDVSFDIRKRLKKH
jgi:uncharacterized protein YybS (DUF2232 family)